MKALIVILTAVVVSLGMAATSHAQGGTTGKYVTVWYLEVKYKASSPWQIVGKYDSYASAQQSYFIRARHGGYYEMRIRQGLEWRSNLSSQILRQSPRFPSSIQLLR